MIFARVILAVCIFSLPIVFFFREDIFRDKNTKRLKLIFKILSVCWTVSLLAYIYSEYSDITNLQKFEMETQRLATETNDLSLENETLIETKNTLISQNEFLKSEIRKHQIENSTLKNTLRQTIHRAFRIDGTSNRSIAFRTPYKNLDSQYNFALEAYRDGDVLLAKFALETILESKSDYYNALILLGIIHNEQGNSEEALKCMYKAYDVSKTARILNNIEVIKRNPGKKLPYKIINK